MLAIIQKALSLYASIRGVQTLYGFCQRFAGYYMLWAATGTEQGIVTYPSASRAADDSIMFTTDANDPAIEPGDMLYWRWGTAGHVAVAVGRDLGNGRVLVVHTGTRSADVVLDLPNTVLISHADTMGLDFRGASRTNGRNADLPALEAYNIGAAVTAAPSATPAPAASPLVVTLSAAWYVFPTADAAINAQRGHRGPTVPAGTYQVLEQSGGATRIAAGWLHPKAAAYITGGNAPAAPSAPVERYVRISEPWFVFPSEGAARAAQRGHRGPTIPAGDYRIVSGNGPYELEGSRWIGTGRTNPPVITK